MDETFESPSPQPTQGSQVTTDTRRQVTFTPPPSAPPRTPRKPKRAPNQKLRAPPTPYARTLFKKTRASQGVEHHPNSSNAGPSSNEDPFITLDTPRPRTLKAEATLCPAVCPACLQPMPANRGDLGEGGSGPGAYINLDIRYMGLIANNTEPSLDDVTGSMSSNPSVSSTFD
ncbi:hypothetical protein MD484_g5012, partial [Candolleomyces efflorescens]